MNKKQKAEVNVFYEMYKKEKGGKFTKNIGGLAIGLKIVYFRKSVDNIII